MYVDYNNVNIENITQINGQINNGYDVVDLSKYDFKFNGEDESAKLDYVLSAIKPKVVIVPEGKTLTLDTMHVYNDNLTIKNYGKIKVKNTLQFWGNNSGIDGGIVEGNLKITQLKNKVKKGSTTLELKNNPFKVGDEVYIRTSLGSLDGNMVAPKVVASKGNTITVDTPVTSDTVAESYVANFNWNSTLCFRGNSFLKNCQIYDCTGYAFNIKGNLDCKNVTVDRNGMDIVSLEGSLTADNLKLGVAYADSTQGISIVKDNAKLYLKNSTIKRNNCDSDIYIYGEIKNVECTFIHCEFDGRYDKNISFRPKGKDKGSTNLYEMAIVRNASSKTPKQSVNKLYFEDCNIHDYSQAVLHFYQSASLKNTFTVNSIQAKNCDFKNVSIMANFVEKLNVKDFQFNGCKFTKDDTYRKKNEDWGSFKDKIQFNDCTFTKFPTKKPTSTIIYNNCTYPAN